MHFNNRVRGAAIGLAAWLLTLSAWAAQPLMPYETAAGHLAAAFSEGDTTVFDSSVSADAILDTAFDGLVLDAEWKSGFHRGLKVAIETKLGQKIVSQMPEGAYAKVLRVKAAGGVVLALIRLDYGDSGTGYMDMHLKRMSDGQVQIVDWYDYSTGQLYSQSLRQIIALMSPTPTVLGKVFDLMSNRKDSIDAVVKLVKLGGEDKHEQTARKFLAMDEDLRRNRMLNIIAVQAANTSGNEELYRKTLANLDRYYRADPSMAFLLLDFYFLEGQYDQALSALDTVQASFGVEDASLFVFKANALSAGGRHKVAAQQAMRAIEIEPEYELGYWSLLSALVLGESFAQAVPVAKALEEKFDYDMGPESLGAHETYAAFVASGEYKRWRGMP